jgi:hypothetical protein
MPHSWGVLVGGEASQVLFFFFMSGKQKPVEHAAIF